MIEIFSDAYVKVKLLASSRTADPKHTAFATLSGRQCADEGAIHDIGYNESLADIMHLC